MWLELCFWNKLFRNILKMFALFENSRAVFRLFCSWLIFAILFCFVSLNLFCFVFVFENFFQKFLKSLSKRYTGKNISGLDIYCGWIRTESRTLYWTEEWTELWGNNNQKQYRWHLHKQDIMQDFKSYWELGEKDGVWFTSCKNLRQSAENDNNKNIFLP